MHGNHLQLQMKRFCLDIWYYLQIPIGSGKSFTGLVDLITRQKMTWQGSSLTHDGRAFEISTLQPSDDPDVLQAVSEARGTLIEQVKRKKCVWNPKNRRNANTFNVTLNTTYFLLQNTKDILNIVCVQTTVDPTDIHCLKKRRKKNTETFFKVSSFVFHRRKTKKLTTWIFSWIIPLNVFTCACWCLVIDTMKFIYF